MKVKATHYLALVLLMTSLTLGATSDEETVEEYNRLLRIERNRLLEANKDAWREYYRKRDVFIANKNRNCLLQSASTRFPCLDDFIGLTQDEVQRIFSNEKLWWAYEFRLRTFDDWYEFKSSDEKFKKATVILYYDENYDNRILEAEIHEVSPHVPETKNVIHRSLQWINNKVFG